MKNNKTFKHAIRKDLPYSFSLFVVWENLPQNKTRVSFSQQLLVIDQRAGIKIL